MLKLVIIGAVVAAACADPVVQEEAESRHKEHAHPRDIHEDMRRTEQLHKDLSIPNVKRLYNPRNIMFDPHNHEQKRIIEDFLSPDYAPETVEFDFRYLPTGGRDFTRADGGQIIILPKGLRSKEHKDYPFDNYDELLEFLRLRKIAELEKKRLHEEDHVYHKVKHPHSRVPHDEHGHREHGSREHGSREHGSREHERHERPHPRDRNHDRHVPRKHAPIIHKEHHE